MILRKLLPVIIFFCLPPAWAMELSITGRALEGYVALEYNRSFAWCGELSSIGSVKFNNRCAFRSGISFGRTEVDTDIKTFTGIQVDPVKEQPLHVSAAYIYNGMPLYKTHSHTIMPLVSCSTKRAGIAIGTGFRFTRFFDAPVLFESVVSFSGFFNFISRETLDIGVSCANFGDFYAGNLGAYSFGLNSAVHANRQFSIINRIRLMQSGSIALSANFYGIAWQSGLQYTW